eukprot:8597550-Alexandrium_andersonii.AAC.1
MGAYECERCEASTRRHLRASAARPRCVRRRTRARAEMPARRHVHGGKSARGGKCRGDAVDRVVDN